MKKSQGKQTAMRGMGEQVGEQASSWERKAESGLVGTLAPLKFGLFFLHAFFFSSWPQFSYLCSGDKKTNPAGFSETEMKGVQRAGPQVSTLAVRSGCQA